MGKGVVFNNNQSTTKTFTKETAKQTNKQILMHQGLQTPLKKERPLPFFIIY
jgi:hypothetical protein